MDKIYPPKSPVSVPEPPGFGFSRLLRNGLLSITILTATMMGAVPQNGERQPCWGSDQRCPDGKYRDRNGNEQPDMCDNHFSKSPADKCACHHATECPERNEDGSIIQKPESPHCKVYCRKDHCHCVGPCDT